MMNEQMGSINGGSVPLPEQVEDKRENTTTGCCFGRWIVAVYEFCKSIKQKYYNWQAREPYKQLLRDYNISDVFMAPSGENIILGQGMLSSVERYQVTGEDNQPYEIAYKSPDISGALNDHAYAMSGEELLKEVAQERVNQEKQVIAKLSHPNIISPVFLDEKNEFAAKKTVFKTGTLSEEEKNSLKESIPSGKSKPDFDFEVIESVTTGPGGIPLPVADKSLRAHLSEDPLTAVQKDCAIRELAAAIGHMHKNGYIHLNIKPENILRKGDEWLLCDFGIAMHFSQLYRASEDSMPLMTKSGSSGEILFGTPGYISPQMYARRLLQHSSADVQEFYGPDIFAGKDVPPFTTDARHTDAYSLGIVLFEILTGVNPTPDDEILEKRDFAEIPASYQEHVDMLLDEHREAIGNYYDVVAGLLKSDCSHRMTVAEAEDHLARIARPD